LFYKDKLFAARIRNWIFGNAFIISPGIITAAFDYAFGAGFELKTSKVHFELVRIGEE